MPVDRPHLDVGSPAELRRWLEANHATAEGAWFVRHRKGSERHIPYGEVVEELLCFGWIDGHARPRDDRASLLLITPRRERSRWSKVNRDRVAKLRAEGRLAPAGEQAVAEAKASGAWDALKRPSRWSSPTTWPLRSTRSPRPGRRGTASRRRSARACCSGSSTPSGTRPARSASG